MDQLHDAGFVVEIFSYVGPGHWLFLAMLSKSCKKAYEPKCAHCHHKPTAFCASSFGLNA
jgi:hypothetical protein